MKKTIRYLVSVILVMALVAGLAGCGASGNNNSEIEETLSKFETACRNLDTDGILECIDPDIADPIRFALALVSSFTDADYTDLLDSIFDNLDDADLGESYNAEELLKDFTISDIKIEDMNNKNTKATVACTISFELNGESFNRDSTIKMVKDDDSWYIASVNMFSSENN